MKRNPNKIEPKETSIGERKGEGEKILSRVTKTILTSLLLLNLQNPKLDNSPMKTDMIPQNQESIVKQETQIIEKSQEQKFKDITDFTFALEGYKKDKPITEASYHGNEDFMTTYIGITEDTYRGWQKEKGIESPKSLTEISEEESYQIIKEIFWDKIEDHEKLPESIMLMRFQAIWNLGEGTESKIWEYVISQTGDYSIDLIDPMTQLKMVEIYAKKQANVSKEVHLAEYITGINSRIEKSKKKALSLIDNVAKNKIIEK